MEIKRSTGERDLGVFVLSVNSVMWLPLKANSGLLSSAAVRPHVCGTPGGCLTLRGVFTNWKMTRRGDQVGTRPKNEYLLST